MNNQDKVELMTYINNLDLEKQAISKLIEEERIISIAYFLVYEYADKKEQIILPKPIEEYYREYVIPNLDRPDLRSLLIAPVSIYIRQYIRGLA